MNVCVHRAHTWGGAGRNGNVCACAPVCVYMCVVATGMRASVHTCLCLYVNTCRVRTCLHLQWLVSDHVTMEQPRASPIGSHSLPRWPWQPLASGMSLQRPP